MIKFLLLLACLPSFHCAAINETTFSSLQELFDDSNCSITLSIIETKFGNGVENSHLKAFLVPLEECSRVPDIPQLTEPYRLCKEVSRALYNISTCNKNTLDKILDPKTNFSNKNSSEGLCSEFQKLNIKSLNDSECLSCGFHSPMVCKVICQKHFEVCDILLWAYEVQNALVEVSMDTNNGGSLTEVTKSTVDKPSISNLNTDPSIKHTKSKNKKIAESPSITASVAEGITNENIIPESQLKSSKQTANLSDSDNLLNQNSDGGYSKTSVNNKLAEHDKTGNGADTKNIEKNPEVKTKDSPSTKNIERTFSSPISQSNTPLMHEGSSNGKYAQITTNRSKHQDEDTKKSEQQQKENVVSESLETELDQPKDVLNQPVPQSSPQNVDNMENYDGEYDDTHTKQKLTKQKGSNLDSKKAILTNVITSNPEVEINKEVTTNIINKSQVVSVTTKPSVQSESPQPSQSLSLDGDQFVSIASHDELLPSEGDEPADTSSFMGQKGISDNVKPVSDEYDLPLDEESETQKDKVEKPTSKFSEGNFRSGKEVLFPEQEDTHFFFYFLSIVMIVMICYLVFHNKQKIIALIVEGCHERRRRPHGVNYRKLEAK